MTKLIRGKTAEQWAALAAKAAKDDLTKAKRVAAEKAAKNKEMAEEAKIRRERINQRNMEEPCSNERTGSYQKSFYERQQSSSMDENYSVRNYSAWK